MKYFLIVTFVCFLIASVLCGLWCVQANNFNPLSWPKEIFSRYILTVAFCVNVLVIGINIGPYEQD